MRYTQFWRDVSLLEPATTPEVGTLEAQIAENWVEIDARRAELAEREERVRRRAPRKCRGGFGRQWWSGAQRCQKVG